MAIKNTSKKGSIITVDFTGVEGRSVVPNDNYAVRVEEVTKEQGDKGAYLQFVLKITDGEFKGRKLWHICSLAPQSLWNLRATLEAMGRTVPTSKMQLDYRSLKGSEFGVTTELETYKGKQKAKVVDVFKLGEEEAGESSEDQEEAEDSEETEENQEETVEAGEEEEIDLEELSLEELLAFAEEHEIELTKKQKMTKQRAIAAIREEFSE